MAYNEKAKNTNLQKYGNICSLHGVNGVLNDKNIFYKTQKFNRDQVKNAKIRLLKILKENNIKLLSDINSLKKLYGNELEYICLNCGCEFKHFQRYKPPICPNCKNKEKRSKAEDEILMFIKSFYKGRIIKNDRNIIHPKELDIYLPDIKLAIEYNGVYFHMINKQSSFEKYNLCKEKNIKLIQIFDCQWSLEKTRIKKAIKCSILNGGCLYLNKDGSHNNQFPLYKEIKIEKIINPQKIFLKDYNKKCPKSQQNYFFIDCGAFLIDIELSKALYQNLIC